ncbi:MAG: hypothetical protein KGI00_01445 [Candidatus Micrarchaeota archaeon]|nr:hypothetical protein [Candidatus Micrarchaeota archaeon]MDE1849374.1 hypothetical protein [Candidatus Micrarchaeota archaeon]
MATRERTLEDDVTHALTHAFRSYPYDTINVAKRVSAELRKMGIEFLTPEQRTGLSKISNELAGLVRTEVHRTQERMRMGHYS